MGLAGMVLIAISSVVGAVMYWATTAQSSAAGDNSGSCLPTLGVIPIIAGAAGFLVSLAIFVSSRREPSEPAHTLDRGFVDDSGHRSVMHERQS